MNGNAFLHSGTNSLMKSKTLQKSTNSTHVKVCYNLEKKFLYKKLLEFLSFNYFSVKMFFINPNEKNFLNKHLFENDA